MSRYLGAVRQNGYVVRDIQAAMSHWIEKLGVGPFYLTESVPLDWFKYHGVSQQPNLSIALANSGDLQIELIQQNNDAPSMYLDFLSNYGEGLQHMSWWSNNYQQDYDAALERGLTIGQEGQVNGGRFVYFDNESDQHSHCGTMIELSDISGCLLYTSPSPRDS